MDDVNLEGAILFADSNRGVFIPQFFAQSVKRDLVTGIHLSEYLILDAGPDHAEYWEVWECVTNNCVVKHPDGTEYVLYQDGDLWLVPKDIAEAIDIDQE